MSDRDLQHTATLQQDLQTQLVNVNGDPYSISNRMYLSKAYIALGFPDLAVGEAYLALLLIDEVEDESGEFHDEAAKSFDTFCRTYAEFTRADSALRHFKLEAQVVLTISAADSYTILIFQLFGLGCLKPACDFLKRGTAATGEDPLLENIRKYAGHDSEVLARLGMNLNITGEEYDDLPDRCMIRRELYFWNEHEPNRYESDTLVYLNSLLGKVGEKLEVKAVELSNLARDSNDPNDPATIRQLGVFAKEDLQPGELILDELSLLTATSRMNDTFCDACSAPLPGLTSPERQSIVACDDCGETFFCTESCLLAAQESYHPAVCDADVSSIAKDASAKSAADDLYSLLLLRSLAMAVTQDVHPLDLPEVKYIWGDYVKPKVEYLLKESTSPIVTSPKTLPFSFRSNVLLPIHMLEKMDVNIFENSNRFAPWVINTLYAKFRGTASARQGPDGKPEVGAVHPLWCLANHSCDPNVRWEWKGGMKFWVREERVTWNGKSTAAEAGIKKGEEILSHYCDIEMPVKERREWAAGALGGLCRCDRCNWEASYAARTQETE